MNFLDRIWSRLRGKEPDPTIGTQIRLAGGAFAVTDAAREGDSPSDYGWSGDHTSGGGSNSGGGGGFDGGGGGDSGGGGGP